MIYVIIWDIETSPDLQGFAAANYLIGKTDNEIREVLGDKFPKHIYHSIVCIGALVAHRENDYWAVDALGAPHVGDRSEKELIQAFVDKIAELNMARFTSWSPRRRRCQRTSVSGRIIVVPGYSPLLLAGALRLAHPRKIENPRFNSAEICSKWWALPTVEIGSLCLISSSASDINDAEIVSPSALL